MLQNWKGLVSGARVASSSSAAAAAAATAAGGRQVRRPPVAARCLHTKGPASSSSTKRAAPAVASHTRRQQSTTHTNLAPTSAQAERQAAKQLDEDEDGDQLLFAATKQEPELLLGPAEAHRFLHRHIGPRREDLEAMLNRLGHSTLDGLIEATIPGDIRLRRELELPEPISEQELLEQLKELGARNAPGWRNFIGMGYYDCVTPPAILRNMFESPGWTTAYTAYQAEIAQGRLEGLANYQTMVCDLTGLDVANASLLDEATAAAEALQVCLRQDTKLKRNRWLVSSRCHPQTLAVVESRAKGLGVEVDHFDELLQLDATKLDTSNYCGLLVQYPNTEGHLFDLNKLTEECHRGGCLVVVATDLLACTLFKPPGDFERPADLAVGSSQRLGVPLNFGGPHAAFLACKQELVRSIPGRVVGLTRDSQGRPAYRFALQTREQHIRRDKATSNICTAQALLANMSAMYAVYHGPQGLRDIAASIHAKTSLLAHLLATTTDRHHHHHQLLNEGSFFDTLTLSVEDQAGLRQRAQAERINLRYYPNQQKVSISLDETTKLADIFRLASLFLADPSQDQSSANNQAPSKASLANKFIINEQQLERPVEGKLAGLKRTTSFLAHPTFNSHRSEAQLVRYMKRLENKDISLAHSMIPLGSCTMKLNATSQMVASSWPEFARSHPYQPLDQCAGYLQLFQDLNDYLCEITGYDRISFQPNSGAQGEYAGLRAIKSYLEAQGEGQRNVCLIPISAHGTNPASAQMAGFKCQTIRVLEDGNIDLADLKANIERHRQQLACLMVTYPSTFGVFEESIGQVCRLVHEAGGQVYLDGANMNAQVGLCRPGDYGSDVSHLNLHKTFCIPHGGGGPGAGPIGVKRHLIPYLPGNPLANDQHRSAVSAAMWGSAAILPISWSYIRLMGRDLKLSSQVAILNANYMRKRLERDYKILFRGAGGHVAHEFILDCRPFKKTANVEAADIAKRLQDFGLHAPTVSWPVANTLMLEPTESEDKQQLDRYCDALLAIRQEIRQIECGQLDRLDNPIKNAPHTQQVVCQTNWPHAYSREQAAFPNQLEPQQKLWPTVGRVDDTYGDTNLFCSCAPPASGATA